MIEELYINGKAVDIETVDIVRRYLSPYFQDVNSLSNDSTYTIKLPMTEKNMAAFGYMNREDMNTSIPYDFLRADYYVNGLPIIVNGQARVLEVSQSIDIQITYGINRAKYAPLFKRKLNEITVRGGITSDDWIVKWNKYEMFATGKKYKYLEYVSGERESDLLDSGNVTMPIPAPWNGHEKEMTMHPYISYGNILDLIIADHNIDNPSNTIATDTFDLLKTNVANKGLILGGNKANFSWSDSVVYLEDEVFSDGQRLRITDETIYRSGFFSYGDISSFLHAMSTVSLYGAIMDIEKYPLIVSLNLLLTSGDSTKQPEIDMFRSKRDGSGSELVTTLPYTIDSEGDSFFNTTFEIQAERQYLYYFLIRLVNAEGGENIVVVNDGSLIITMNIDKAIYSIVSSVVETQASGHYNCLMNLPDMTAMEFVQEMMVLSGCGVSYDNDGKMTFVKLDSLNLSQSYDWTNKISLIQSGVFKFNNMAQRNRIAYANSQNVNHVCEGFINVSDLTLDEQQDMYVLKFNAPDKNQNGLAEFILYKQKVTEQTSGVSFANEYNEKPSVAVYDNSGDAIVEIIKPNDIDSQVGFINANYINFKKLVNRPIVKDVEVNIDFFTSANLDLKKAVYVGEWGKYCIVLELNAPNKEVATAKLLLINQSL